MLIDVGLSNLDLFIGNTIAKGMIRVGTIVDFRGNTSLYAFPFILALYMWPLL